MFCAIAPWATRVTAKAVPASSFRILFLHCGCGAPPPHPEMPVHLPVILALRPSVE